MKILSIGNSFSQDAQRYLHDVAKSDNYEDLKDIISFDAYNNPNNLSIIPEVITEFIARGGRINWGIVPVVNEAKVKDLNIDEITSRLFKTFEPLIVAGVPADYVYKSALVSVQGDLNHLPIIFAEKAVILADQLSKRLPIKN